MKNRGMQQRLGFAWEGIAVAWRNERSFRIQTVFAFTLPGALLLREEVDSLSDSSHRPDGRQLGPGYRTVADILLTGSSWPVVRI